MFSAQLSSCYSENLTHTDTSFFRPGHYAGRNQDRSQQTEASYPDERSQGITAVSNCDP